MRSNRYLTVAGAMLIFTFLAIGGTRVVYAAKVNWAKLVTTTAWINITLPETQTASLHDKIPDGWYPSNWGSALAEFRLDQGSAFEGKHTAYIHKNGESDYSVYSQTFQTPRNARVNCSIAHRGVDSFGQVHADGISGQTDLALEKSDSWQTSLFSFVAPEVESKVTLNIGIGAGVQGEAWFDGVKCSMDESNEKPLIDNGGFEDDGTAMDFDFVQWWNAGLNWADSDKKMLTHAYEILRSSDDLNSLNAIDLLLGFTERVVERMRTIEPGCPDVKAQPGLLLGLSRSLPSQSEVEQEYLGRLSIELMPACPQSYAFLSSLYRSAYAFKQAARYAHEAALHTPEISQRGLYFFVEGELYTAYIGDYESAVDALEQAKLYTGWEPSPSHFGSLDLYLGQALTELHRCAEARKAFDEVLNCPRCASRHSEADEGIRRLAVCRRER